MSSYTLQRITERMFRPQLHGFTLHRPHQDHIESIGGGFAWIMSRVVAHGSYFLAMSRSILLGIQCSCLVLVSHGSRQISLTRAGGLFPAWDVGAVFLWEPCTPAASGSMLAALNRPAGLPRFGRVYLQWGGFRNDQA